MRNSQPVSYPRTLPVSLPGFDLADALDRMMGRTDLWWKVLYIFHRQFGSWDAAWRLTQGQRENERKSVHSLRSAAANIGAFRLAAAAAELEQVLMASDFQEAMLPPLRRRLQESFDEAINACVQALQTITPAT